MPQPTGRSYVFEVIDVVIPASGSLSVAVKTAGRALVAIIMPSAWTAANLTFQGAESLSGAFKNVYDTAGTEYTITAAADRYIVLAPDVLAGLDAFKVRSGTAGAPVNQAAERIVGVVLRRLAT